MFITIGKGIQMGKVTLRGLVPENSPIYEQPLTVGARLTTPSQKNTVKSVYGLDLQNLPFDPAAQAVKESLLEENKNTP